MDFDNHSFQEEETQIHDVAHENVAKEDLHVKNLKMEDIKKSVKDYMEHNRR